MQNATARIKFETLRSLDHIETLEIENHNQNSISQQHSIHHLSDHHHSSQNSSSNHLQNHLHMSQHHNTQQNQQQQIIQTTIIQPQNISQSPQVSSITIHHPHLHQQLTPPSNHVITTCSSPASMDASSRTTTITTTSANLHEHHHNHHPVMQITHHSLPPPSMQSQSPQIIQIHHHNPHSQQPPPNSHQQQQQHTLVHTIKTEDVDIKPSIHELMAANNMEVDMSNNNSNNTNSNSNNNQQHNESSIQGMVVTPEIVTMITPSTIGLYQIFPRWIAIFTLDICLNLRVHQIPIPSHFLQLDFLSNFSPEAIVPQKPSKTFK